MGDFGHVDLVIKNPSLPDTEFRTSVPLASSVRELKEELHRTHPCRPPVAEQKIIFAGKVLHDADELHGHMARHDTSTPITLHLVIRQASASLPAHNVCAAPARGADLPAADDVPPVAPWATGAEAAAATATASAGAMHPPPVYSQLCYVVAGQQPVWYEVHGQPYVFLMPSWQPLPASLAQPPQGAVPFGMPYFAHAGGAHMPYGAGWGVMPPCAWPPPPAASDAAAAAHGAAMSHGEAPGQARAGAGPGPVVLNGGDGGGGAANGAGALGRAAGAAAEPGAADELAQVMRRDAVQLVLKLALLVFMLGQDGDTDRLLVLSAVAVLIFLFQTNQLAGLLPPFRAAAQPGQPAPATPPAAAQPPPPPSALRSFFHLVVAFFSSLFPGWQLHHTLQADAHPDAYDGEAQPGNVPGAAAAAGANDIDAGAAAQAAAQAGVNG